MNSRLRGVEQSLIKMISSTGELYVRPLNKNKKITYYNNKTFFNCYY